MNFSKFKIAFVTFICFLGVLFACPNFVAPKNLKTMPFFLQKQINLGLELKGGSHLQLQVGLDEAYKATFERLNFKKNLKKDKIAYTDYKISAQDISFKLKDIKDYEKIAPLLKDLDRSLKASINDTVVQVFYDPALKRERDLKIIDQSIEVVRRRVDESGTKEPFIYNQGVDRIILQLPGVEDPAHVKKLLGQTGRLTFRLVAGIVGKDKIFNKDILTIKNSDEKYYVDPEVLLTGEDITTVKVTADNGKNGVSFELNTYGTERFKEITTKNIGKQLAIVIDNEIVTAPMIHQAIPYGQAVISSEKTTLEEATQLKLILASGSLPAPLKVIEERIVGPSLGADSINSGKSAVIWSFVFVTLFMVFVYRLFGVFASISLIFNVILLLACLTLMDVTLTLPGIAGIALTIGIAVDANVLIYERIKEELRLGIKPFRAIVLGFERAMTTIIDANLTTLIGAFILYEFGSGPIRGFSVTLALGIVISMFTALTLTQLQIYLWSRNRKLEKLPIGSVRG